MESKRIFSDPSGRRARLIARVLLVIVAVPATVILLFFYDIWIGEPVDPLGIAAEFRRIETAQAPGLTEVSFDEGRDSLTFNAKTSTTEGPLTVAFYANWDDNSFPSLRKHIGQIDWIIPDWFSLQGDDLHLVTEIDENVIKLFHKAERAPFVLPLLTNSSDAGWDGAGLARILSNKSLRLQRIKEIRDSIIGHGFQGVAVQFEELPAESSAALTVFLQELATDLHSHGLIIATVLPLADSARDYAAIGAISDKVVLLGFEPPTKHEMGAPLEPALRLKTELQRRLTAIPAEKVVLTVANYGRDWSAGPNGAPQTVDLSFRDVLLLARDHRVKPDFDQFSDTPVLRYFDGTAEHTVWFLDGVTAQNTIDRVKDLSLAGYALWRLGSEDPTTWYALPVAGKLSRKPEQFEHVPMAQDIFLTGSGDFLRVTSAPVDGVRVVEPDPTAPLGQLVERYQTVPVPVTVNRYGAVPGAVALTFDDGPDRRWTPEILDILAKEGVKATFFVTGENAAFAPDLVQRMIADGHELGNHTFTHPNMGTASDIVSVLEINGTQRLIEATSGRKMRMFRAPYVGDSEPATLDEVRPLLLAQERGLYVVGLRADSHDWKHVAVNDIVASVMREVGTLDHQKSQTILFHDAGGDRSATVAALPVVIEALRARGFQIVPASFFAGETQASIMPEVPKWTFSRLIASLFFTALRLLAQIATFLFFGAIGLGLARLVLICWLAIMQGRKKHATAAPPSGDSLVSVLIPAFNEQKVINGCIDRLLKSSYRNIEVLVIDDGSTDATAECAARVAAQDQRLRVFTIANGGKANALNFGLRHSHGETVIALDADTQFQSETVARLVRWFENPSVVAVAGNAKVGNRVNFLTRCQALEYITAQNLERRAYAALGCITVVPGAVGAWRRSSVLGAGGFPDDTLAEDQDLTLTLQRQGGEILYDATAIAETEAPDTLRGLMRQRFRWCFGTMQCLWKHRQAMVSGRPRIIGWFALPQILMFQIVFSVIAPIIDVSLLFRLIAYGRDYIQHGGEVDTEALQLTLTFYGIFLLAEVLAGLAAFILEKRERISLLWLIIPQRFGYRQLLCLIAIRALIVAAAGQLVGWGHLERKASVVASAD